MKKYLLGIFLTIVLLLGLTASIYTQDDKIPQARFAFYHASPNTPAVDLLLEDEVVFENISYGERTEFLLKKPGKLLISVRVSGSSDTVIGPIMADLKQGRDNILCITGMISSQRGADFPPIEAKMLVKKTRPAFFRFYNTSPDSNNVNVYIEDDLYFENVEYGQPTKFEKIGSGEVNLKIKRNGDEIVSQIVSFKAGRAYTVVLLGLEGDSQAGLRIELVEE